MKRSYSRGSIRHMCMNIAGVLKHTKKGKLTFIDDDDGVALSDQRARLELNRLQIQGYMVMDCSGECYRFDKINGCPGHIKSLKPHGDVLDKIELDYLLFKQGKRL